MPRRLGIVGALACLTLACSRPAPSAAIPGSGEPEPAENPTEPDAAELPEELAGSHVVVASGARFYASADAEDPLPTRSALEDVAPGILEAEHVGWVMRRGPIAGSRVELTLVGGADPRQSCGRGMAGLENFELIWWVEREDLLPVTTEATRLRFKDGGALSLPPGIPILPAADDEPPRVAAWSVQVPLTHLAADQAPPATALAFDPDPLPEPEPEAGVELPEGALVLGRALLDPAPFRVDGRVRARATREVDGQTLVTLRSPCVELEALLGPPRPYIAGFQGFHRPPIFDGVEAPNFFRAPAGATIRWPDGSVAGHTREAARYYELGARGSGLCSYFRVGDETWVLPLCFAEDAVTPLELGVVRIEQLRRNPSWTEPESLEWPILVFHESLRVPCLSPALEADPKLELRLRVHLRVDAELHVAEIEIEPRDGEPDDELLACLRRAYSSWRPYPHAGTELDFELVYEGGEPFQ